MSILAIDPGNTLSGYALVDAVTCRPIEIGKIPNDDLFEIIAKTDYIHLAIEMVASYGMPVGREVFETCVWIGRFAQHHDHQHPPVLGIDHALVYRRDVKLHHCHSARAKDSNITQALIDRFALNEPNRGKGTKTEPGWFHGFAGDIWQAYALAVYAADTKAAVGADGAPY
jgi:hypothetical protein